MSKWETVELTESEVNIIDHLVLKHEKEMEAFEAHAVEVLFKYISRHHEMTEEKEKAMRTEARQLLGWEE